MFNLIFIFHVNFFFFNEQTRFWIVLVNNNNTVVCLIGPLLGFDRDSEGAHIRPAEIRSQAQKHLIRSGLVCVEMLWKCIEACWDFVCIFMFLHKFIQSVFCFEWPWESLWLPWQALEEFPEQTHQTTTSTSINIRDTQTAKEVSSVPLTVNGGRVFRPEVWTIEVDWTRLFFLKMALHWVMLTGTLLSTIP